MTLLGVLIHRDVVDNTPSRGHCSRTFGLCKNSRELGRGDVRVVRSFEGGTVTLSLQRGFDVGTDQETEGI